MHANLGATPLPPPIQAQPWPPHPPGHTPRSTHRCTHPAFMATLLHLPHAAPPPPSPLFPRAAIVHNGSQLHRVRGETESHYRSNLVLWVLADETDPLRDRVILTT